MSTSKLTNKSRILFVAFAAALFFTMTNVQAWTVDDNGLTATESVQVAIGTEPGFGGG